MSNVKEKMTEVIQSQPEDATYEEIMRELAFERMIERGLLDSRKGPVVTSKDHDYIAADNLGTATFTSKQGRYLAFIYDYTKVHGYPPAEADLQRYFRVSPPTVHQMILTLEARGFIERTPGRARSIKLRLSRAELPDLE
jgi:repressor LexA